MPCIFVCEECKQEDKSVPEEMETECVCVEEDINTNCPICGAKEADLNVCEGEPTKEEAECICEVPCTEDKVNADYPVCSAEDTDLTQCEGKKINEQVKAVQELIDALPTAEELNGMSKDEQNEVYNVLQAVYDAYEALTVERKDHQTLLTRLR